MKKLITLLFLTAMAVPHIRAQQIPSLSQYTLNHYAINPAATGITEKIPVAFTYRKLWAGIRESPSIQYLSGDMQFAEDMGAGMKIFNYQTGPLRKTGIEGTYSYHIEVSSSGTRLSFGLSALLYQLYLDKSNFTIETPDDPVFLGTDKMIVPDASFGMYLYGEKYFAGISVPQLFNRNVDLKTDRILQQKQVRHYYLQGGYMFDLGTDFKLEPSLLFKFVEAGLFQADINTRLIFRDMLLTGLSYRTSEALVIQLGYQNKDLVTGYSFDLTLNGLNAKTFGSHEIFLMYRFASFVK